MDWGIINKQYLKNKKNVFALYLDNNTGLVFAYPANSTGQAGPSLSAYIQRYGIPKIIVHDNAGILKRRVRTTMRRQKYPTDLQSTLHT